MQQVTSDTRVLSAAESDGLATEEAVKRATSGLSKVTAESRTRPASRYSPSTKTLHGGRDRRTVRANERDHTAAADSGARRAEGMAERSCATHPRHHCATTAEQGRGTGSAQSRPQLDKATVGRCTALVTHAGFTHGSLSPSSACCVLFWPAPPPLLVARCLLPQLPSVGAISGQVAVFCAGQVRRAVSQCIVV